MPRQAFDVRLLCTGNSAPSILAEAILNAQDRGLFGASSAGSTPTGQVQPQVLELLERSRLPVEGLRSKSWDEFARPGAPRTDFAITVCDKARAGVCPVRPARSMRAHRGVGDRAQAVGDEQHRNRIGHAR